VGQHRQTRPWGFVLQVENSIFLKIILPLENKGIFAVRTALADL
jgi:hypothetical protein